MATQQKRFRKDDGNRNPPKEAPNVLDRSPPFDLAAETGVIGSLMLNPDAANELSLVLRADDFYDDANRKLYSAMMNMFDSGRKFDTTLLVNELKASGDFELVGGFGYLAKTANSVPNAAHAVYY
ncbi:MAG: DnaB-like helicase N-terminal domain-containing protein, partial [bacterium]